MVSRFSKQGARRRLLVCSSTLLCLLIADVLVRRAEPLLRAYDIAPYYRKPNALRARGVPQIVLMGSSRVKYALVPDDFETVFGVSTFNLGIPGSKVVEWLELARDLFSERKPRLIVLGINADEVPADYQPLAAARYLFTSGDLLESWSQDGPSFDVIGNYLWRKVGPTWAIYHQRYEFKMWFQEKLEALLPKYAQESRELRRYLAKPCPPKGYDHPWTHGRQLGNLGQQLLEDRAAIVWASTPNFSRNAGPYRRLGQLLDWFRRQGIIVLVAYLPNSPETEYRWSKVEPKMIDTIEAVCRAHDVSFLRCDRESVPRSNHDFLEEFHMGFPLAHRISLRIARRIRTLALLERPQPRLASAPEDNKDLP